MRRIARPYALLLLLPLLLSAVAPGVAAYWRCDNAGCLPAEAHASTAASCCGERVGSPDADSHAGVIDARHLGTPPSPRVCCCETVAGSAAACLLARLAGIHSLAVSLAPVALCDAGPPAPQGRIGRPAQFTPPSPPDCHPTPGRRGPPLS